MTRPNIILILVDDMGFSDLGLMGSEIQTPNLDYMAENGTLLSSMYNCARCCPTRASMLTGQYPHAAGIGQMCTNLGVSPAYQGYLRDDTVTIAEALKTAGYRTMMAGKWHVGGDLDTSRDVRAQIGRPEHPTPQQRGFDQFYGFFDGVTHFFTPHLLEENGVPITEFDEDFYITDALTDKSIEMIEASVAADEPYFLYLSHPAPHWPLHARPEDIAKYDGVYDKGWDAIRTARHEEMNGNRVLKSNWDISPRDESAPAWSDAPHQAWEASKMAAFAAMVDRVDQGIGRILETLKANGTYDNTLILFLSDNGGCAEFMAEDGWAKFYPDTTVDGRKIKMGNHPHVTPGDALTYQSYDLPWANVSNAPFRLFKHWTHEGGISTPMVVHWPARLKDKHVQHAACHVVDVLPTLLEAAGASYPTEYNDNTIQPLAGESLIEMFTGTDWEREQPIYWEHEGNSAIRIGNLKLVREFNKPWELYDMDVDRTELHDLINKLGPHADRLTRDYEAWASKQGVLDWNVALPLVLKAWGMTDIHG